MRADAVEKLEAALELGLAMRHAQKEYFKHRKNSDLEEARRLEREYDLAALEASKAVSGQPIQGSLL